MQKSLESIQSSSSFLQNIKSIQDIPIYVKNVPQSKYVVIAFHEHLGLVQNFTSIVQNLIDNATIIVPDLFCYISQQQNQNQEQFQPIKKLKFSDVRNIILKCYNYAKSKNQFVIFLGFSIGSAFGLRLLQQCPQVSMGIFFYGYPKIQSLKNNKLACQTKIFHASKDKIKYLSDRQQLQSFQSYFQQQKLLQISQINQAHGFMNPQSDAFSQSAFIYCKSMIHEMIKNRMKAIVQQNKQKLKKDQSSCIIF